MLNTEDERGPDKRDPVYVWRESDQVKLMWVLGQLTGQLVRITELLEGLLPGPRASQDAREASPTPRDASEPPWPSAGST